MPETRVEPEAPAIAAPASWPMTFVWLGDHLTQDWMRMWSGAARVADPLGAAQTEGQAAGSLMRDWIVAMGALWTLPMSAWLAAQASTPDQPR